MLDGKEIEVKKIFCKVLKSIFASDLSRWILRMLQNFAVIAVLKVYILLLLLVIACNKTLWTYNILKLPFANHVFRGLALGCAWSTRPAHGAISSRRPRIRIKKLFTQGCKLAQKNTKYHQRPTSRGGSSVGAGGWSPPPSMHRMEPPKLLQKRFSATAFFFKAGVNVPPPTKGAGHCSR